MADTQSQTSSQDAEKKLKEKMQELQTKELEKRAQYKAAQLGIPYINLADFPIAPEALTTISKDICEKEKIICFYKSEKDARVGVVDPDNSNLDSVIKKIEDEYFIKTHRYIISQPSLDHALKVYAAVPEYKKTIRGGISITEDDIKKYEKSFKNIKEFEKKVRITPITEVLSLLVSGAIESDSSDIHIESEEAQVVVRYRIDGVLHDIAVLDKEVQRKIISRIKILSGLKINITNRPQDGRFTIYLTKEKIDVRVSTLPTAFGESVVLRLLRSSKLGIKFEDIGLIGDAYNRLLEELKKPNGMVMTTGPTGSGKTTTMYSALIKLNDAETKIITIEDPVEYRIEGINQSQVDRSKGYTFANGLKSILRQDPDIVLVGEIRDMETAEIAINAALTGHLVLSTIHTNSASGAIPRFLAMGSKEFLLMPALNAVIGQRLVRKICPKCVVEDDLDEATMEKVKENINKIPESVIKQYESVDVKNLKFKKGNGCDYCHGFGYKGRIGIFEIMVMTPEIEKLVLSKKFSEYDLQDAAIKAGMITMAQDGLLKALKGITTVSEVFRVAR